MIETALVAGFTSVGMDVLLGPVPTPAVAMLTRSMRADLGVMISASHNPFEDNGIKMFGPDGYKLSDEVEREIEALMDADLTKKLAGARTRPRQSRRRRARALCRVRKAHSAAIIAGWPARCGDCANGAGYRVAPEALWELGAEVIAIGVEPDGYNINHDAAPHSPALRKVREVRADVGIALDGDADRVMIVDECGQSWTAINCWRSSPRAGKRTAVSTAGRRRDGDVESGSRALSRGLGLTLVRTAVGDRYVLEQMREHGYNVGGEQSGHIILSDYTTTGDGLVAALQVLAVVKRRKPVSEVCHRFEPVPQILKNVRYRTASRWRPMR